MFIKLIGEARVGKPKSIKPLKADYDFYLILLATASHISDPQSKEKQTLDLSSQDKVTYPTWKVTYPMHGKKER